MNLDNR